MTPCPGPGKHQHFIFVFRRVCRDLGDEHCGLIVVMFGLRVLYEVYTLHNKIENLLKDPDGEFDEGDLSLSRLSFSLTPFSFPRALSFWVLPPLRVSSHNN